MRGARVCGGLGNLSDGFVVAPLPDSEGPPQVVAELSAEEVGLDEVLAEACDDGGVILTVFTPWIQPHRDLFLCFHPWLL